jgi:glutaredoxin
MIAKRYLTEKGCKYKEIDISKNPEAIEIASRKSGQTGVPVIDIDGKIIVGFDKKALDENLIR